MANALTTYEISVNASATLAQGVGAHFRLLVDDVQVGDATVGTNQQSYDFDASLDSSKAHSIKVVYDNDTYVDGQDRNLLLQSISVNGNTVQATDAREVYHATGGPGDLQSTGDMVWAGTAEFNLPSSVFGSGSTSNPVSSLAPAASASAPNAFFVSTTGSDAADGSAAHPFASLARAVAAMEGSAIHTTYVQGGTYNLSSTLTLGQADSGMTIKAVEGQTAVLNGNGHDSLISVNGASGVTLSGLTFSHGGDGGAVALNNTSGVSVLGNHFTDNGRGLEMVNADASVISGNQIENSARDGIEVKDGSDHNLFDSNVINGVSSTGTTGGGMFMHGVNYNTISHNLVENIGGLGIGIENWDNQTINVGNVITDNVVRNTNTNTPYDSGAIYVLGRSGVDTQTVISNNLVEKTGAGGDAHTVAIYLDDYTSGVTVTDNVLRDVGTHGIEIHGGHNVAVTNNVFDLGNDANSAIFFHDIQSGDLHDIAVSGNVITSSKASQQAYDVYATGNMGVSHNEYWNTAGGQINTGPDSSAVVADPHFQDAANGNYALASGSAAGAVGFTQIDQSATGLQPTTEHWYL
ncbi:right-handed parallel beta-helix repeat-containing protein [Roseomonas elaeocarpi]|uniref:Right-handed parallel beta-helix repeat-containing protein n=1 Tax=Roseomonas elaeocarpi TaxID=907779 RepID=A0ABV6JLN7_9PROT